MNIQICIESPLQSPGFGAALAFIKELSQCQEQSAITLYCDSDCVSAFSQNALYQQNPWLKNNNISIILCSARCAEHDVSSISSELSHCQIAGLGSHIAALKNADKNFSL